MVWPAQIITMSFEDFQVLCKDLILTGTPGGVGAFREPSIYMKDGDEVVVEIERIGRLVNLCKSV